MTIVRSFALVIIMLLAARSLCHAVEDPPQLDSQQIEETTLAAAKIIETEYFDADVARRVSDALRQWAMQKRYEDATTGDELATQLTNDLYALTQDKHLAVTVQPKVGQGQSADNQSSRETTGKRTNFGVQRAEVLAGNVGYVNITAFYRFDEARDVLAAAMQIVRHTDALILDLRDNGGGSPESVALLASYFFCDADLPLFEIVPRSCNRNAIPSPPENVREDVNT